MDKSAKVWIAVAIILAVVLIAVLIYCYNGNGGTLVYQGARNTQEAETQDETIDVDTKWNQACCELGLSCCNSSAESSEPFESLDQFNEFLTECAKTPDRCFEYLGFSE